MEVIEKKELVQWAKMAKKAGRYDDMASAMKSVTERGEELSGKERHLLYLAYKNVVGARRSSWRVISLIENQAEGSGRKQQIVREYREKIEKELRDKSLEIIVLLDRILIPNASNARSKVFYLKMKGDFNRYIAEVATGDTLKTAVDDSQKAYQEAFELSNTVMSPIHPLKLCVVMNYAVLLHGFLSSTNQALQIAQQGLDDAIGELDHLDTHFYNHTSILLMQILRQNLNIWKYHNQEDEEPVGGGKN